MWGSDNCLNHFLQCKMIKITQNTLNCGFFDCPFHPLAGFNMSPIRHTSLFYL